MRMRLKESETRSSLGLRRHGGAAALALYRQLWTPCHEREKHLPLLFKTLFWGLLLIQHVKEGEGKKKYLEKEFEDSRSPSSSNTVLLQH